MSVMCNYFSVVSLGTGRERRQTFDHVVSGFHTEPTGGTAAHAHELPGTGTSTTREIGSVVLI